MQKLRPALVAEAQVLNDAQVCEIPRNISGKLLTAAAALLAGDELCKHLQNFVVLVRKGILPLAVHAESAARGHGAAHKGLDAAFLPAGIVAKVALPLVKIGHQQGLTVADYPAHQSFARQHCGIGGDFVPQTEKGGKAVGLAFFFGQKQHHRVGVEHAANNA